METYPAAQKCIHYRFVVLILTDAGQILIPRFIGRAVDLIADGLGLDRCGRPPDDAGYNSCRLCGSWTLWLA